MPEGRARRWEQLDFFCRPRRGNQRNDFNTRASLPGENFEEESNRSGRRFGRFEGTDRCVRVRRGNSFVVARKIKSRALPNQPQVHFETRLHLLFLLLVLFLGPRLFDDFAHRARMFTVKGHAYGFREGNIARVAENHARPRDRLQQRPVQAQGQDQQQDGDDFYTGSHRLIAA